MKILFYSLIFLLIFNIKLLRSEGWEKINNQYLNRQYIDIKFVNNIKGILLLSDSNKRQHEILITKNGGNSWDYIDIDNYFTKVGKINFTSISFPTEEFVILSGYSQVDSTFPKIHIIAISKDFGKSFKISYFPNDFHPLIYNPYYKYFRKVMMVDNRIGYILADSVVTGNNSYHYNSILKSNDGGENWNLVELNKYYSQINNFDIIKDNIRYTCSVPNYPLYLLSAGDYINGFLESLGSQVAHYPDSFIVNSYILSSNFWVVYYNNESEKDITFKKISIDNGESWSDLLNYSLNYKTTYTFSNFPNECNGYLVNWDNIINSYIIYKTKDCGKNIIKTKHKLDFNLIPIIYSVNDSVAYAINNGIEILKTTDEGGVFTDVEEEVNEAQEIKIINSSNSYYSLELKYPPSEAKLELINILGVPLFSQSTSSQIFNISLEPYPTGIYLLKYTDKYSTQVFKLLRE